MIAFSRNALLLSCLVLITFKANAQHSSNPCGFDQNYLLHKSMYDAGNHLLTTALAKSGHNHNKSNHQSIIPVVVHVIHNSGSENISDAQIQSQIDALNEDFGKLAGTRGDGNGVDTEIRFKLSKLTPDGRCTNGIVRIKSTLTNHKTVDRNKLKELSFWDNNRYLNIYVVKSIDNGSGTIGYSSFPNGPDESDGIVVLHNAFGRMGTAVSPNNLGRTMSHEIGHWFGLYHTFQDGCGTDTCSTGDLICDTPPTANPNFGCPMGRNSCSNDALPDQVANYMDYSDDGCKSMFSAGQKDRMHATLETLRDVISSSQNVTSTGCDSGFVNGPCAVISDFVASSRTICTGNPVQFVNKSLNGAKTFKWYFTGGIPDSSTVLNPIVSYASPGSYPVKLIAFDSLNSDTLIVADYILVNKPPIGQSLPYYEGFEAAIFPPSGISIDNPDAGITWNRDTVAIAYEGAASAKINNLININYGQADAIQLPGFDLSSYSNAAYLRFRWAYARSDANYSDQLSVLISVDCGVNYTQIFTRTGSAMATGPTQTTPYIPDSGTVWKEAKINLSAYQTSTNALIKIVNVTDGGNNLYIDDLRIDNLGTGINDNQKNQNGLNVYPNPTADKSIIKYTLQKSSRVQLTIVDVLGKVLYQEEDAMKSTGVYEHIIDFKALNCSPVNLVILEIDGIRHVQKALLSN